MDHLLVFDHILMYLPLTEQEPLNKHHAQVIKTNLYNECSKAATCAALLGLPPTVRVRDSFFMRIPNSVLIQITIATLNDIAGHFESGRWGEQNNYVYCHAFLDFFERIDLLTFRSENIFYRAVAGDSVCDSAWEDSRGFYQVAGAMWDPSHWGEIIDRKHETIIDIFV